MGKTAYIAMVAAVLLQVSCTKATQNDMTGSSVQLDIVPEVAASVKTKQVISTGESNGSGGYYMPTRSSFGLFVCDHHSGSYTDGSNPYSEYAVRYKNIKAVRSITGSWSYSYFGYSEFSTLFVAPKDENGDGDTDNTCDIFAYAPYQDGITALEAIPFNIAGCVDVMYAEQNSDPAINKDIDPADYIPAPYNGHLNVPLTFHHTLSLMEFDITIKNHNYEHPMDPSATHGYTLQAITLAKSNPTAHLYSSGTMNAMLGGELSNLTAAETIINKAPNGGFGDGSVSFGPGATAQAYFLQVPTRPGEDYADGDYVFTFKFSGQTFPITFTLLREHLKHSDGTTYGFIPGYKYTFHFTIDNYVHLEDITIGEWETVTTPALQTEI